MIVPCLMYSKAMIAINKYMLNQRKSVFKFAQICGNY